MLFGVPPAELLFFSNIEHSHESLRFVLVLQTVPRTFRISDVNNLAFPLKKKITHELPWKYTFVKTLPQMSAIFSGALVSNCTAPLEDMN